MELWRLKSLFPNEWEKVKATLIDDLNNDMVRAEEYILSEACQQLLNSSKDYEENEKNENKKG